MLTVVVLRRAETSCRSGSRNGSRLLPYQSGPVWLSGRLRQQSGRGRCASTSGTVRVACVDSPSVRPSAVGPRSGRPVRGADPIARPDARRFPGSSVAGGHRGATRSALDAGDRRADCHGSGRRLRCPRSCGSVRSSSWSASVLLGTSSIFCCRCRSSGGARGRRASAARSAPFAPEARLSQEG